MTDRVHPGSENLTPWAKGESGNPSGLSQCVRARMATSRIGGLAPALRELLDAPCPEALLAELNPEQLAGLDGGPSLARYLAAKLLTTAASPQTFGQLLSALSLIGTIDTRRVAAEVADPVADLHAHLPGHLRRPLHAAFAALASGENVWWEFQRTLEAELGAATKRRLFDTTFDNIDLRKLPEQELSRRFELLDPADVEIFSRVVTQLRTVPINEALERFMAGDEPERER